MAASPLADAMTNTPELAGEIVVIKDLLNVGPLQKTEDDQKFSDIRSSFWRQIISTEKNSVNVDDTERILQVSVAMNNNENAKVWLWIAPWPADICTWLWLTKYFGKYPGRFMVINIAGLPFLDAEGKLYYPKNISELLPKEISKARKLARPVSYAEIENDADDWKKLVAENAGVRVTEGTKRVLSKGNDHYDNLLLGMCTDQFQKASKIVAQTLTKHNIPTGDLYLGWRLKELVLQDRLRTQGELNKSLKDFDIKLPSATLEFVD